MCSELKKVAIPKSRGAQAFIKRYDKENLVEKLRFKVLITILTDAGVKKEGFSLFGRTKFVETVCLIFFEIIALLYFDLRCLHAIMLGVSISTYIFNLILHLIRQTIS